MRIRRENTIAVAIDIQERLFPVMHEKERLLQNCGILLKGLKELEVPLVVSQQYTKGLGPTLAEIQEIISDFTYLDKTEFSCCDAPEIMDQIGRYGAKNILLFGIESHVCVLQTAVDLKEKDYNPVVVMDCVSSRNPANMELARERFRHEQILMASYESILFELTRKAGSEEFKAISRLVR